MKHRNSHFLLGYWSRLRGNRAIPAQRDVDPKAFGRALANVFVLERTPGSGRTQSLAFRLAGTSLCDRFGGELRGVPFLSLFAPSAHGAAGQFCEELRAYHSAGGLSLVAPLGSGTASLEIVLAPVADDRGASTRLLGLMSVLEEPRIAARRFGALEVTGMELLPEPAADQAFETIRRNVSPVFGRATGTPWLRVIDGGTA